MGPKIATCTYCGTRAALVLGGTQQHELACRSCGAPLHDLKALKSTSKAKRGKPPKTAKAPPRRVEPEHRRSLPEATYLSKRVTRKLRRKLARKAVKAVIDLFD